MSGGIRFSLFRCTLWILANLFSIAESKTVDRINVPTRGTYTNSTISTLSPPVLTANATGGLDSADRCWSSWDAWESSSLNCALTTTATSELTFTDKRSSVIYETYKLCDGHPRANATASESTSRTTASESGTAYTTYTDVLPPSGIPESILTTLVTSRATYYETACITPQPSPRCSIGAEECQSLMSMWSAGGFERGKPPCTVPVSPDPCDDCRIYIPTVKLIYFPVTMTGDFCGDYSTIQPSYAGNISVASTVVISGQTFTSGSAYLSYAGVTARAGGTDNAQCGTPLPGGILGLPSSRLSTYRGHAAAMPIASLPPYSLNFADLAPNPVPWDAWISQEGCITHQDYATCQTITQAAYRPWIVYPREFWEMGGEKWKKCGSDVFGIMDPPTSLSMVDDVPMPTMPSVGTGDGLSATTGIGNSQSASPAVSVSRPTADPTSIKTTGGSGATPTEASLPTAPGSDLPTDPAESELPVATETESLPSDTSETDPTATQPSSDAETSPTFTVNFSFDPTQPFGPTIAASSSTTRLGRQTPSSADPETQQNVPPKPPTTPPKPPTTPPNSEASAPAASDGDTQIQSPASASTSTAEFEAPALSILASALSPALSEAPSAVRSAISSVIAEANSILHPGDQHPGTTISPSLQGTGADSTATVAISAQQLDTTTLRSSSSVRSGSTAVVPTSPQNPDGSASLDPTSAQTDSAAVVATIGDDPQTVVYSSDRIIIGSAATLSPGQQTTVSGVPIVAYGSAVLVGSTFMPLPTPDNAESTSAGSSSSSSKLPPVVDVSSSTTNTADLPSITRVSPSEPSPTRDARPAVTTVVDSGGYVPEGQRAFSCIVAFLSVLAVIY